jgi:hypothetical protein
LEGVVTGEWGVVVRFSKKVFVKHYSNPIWVVLIILSKKGVGSGEWGVVVRLSSFFLNN